MSAGLRAGYKQTEVGVIPEDWELTTLGRQVQITSGDSPSHIQFTSSGIPYFKVEQLGNCEKYLSGESTPYYFQVGKTVPGNSIIFAKRGAAISLNRVRILSEDSFMDTNLMSLTCLSHLDPEFLYYGLGYIGLWQFADVTSVPQINNKHVIPLCFQLPPPSEQRAIAKALSDADALIESLDQLITKKRNLKQAAMQQLLTGQTRLPGFSGEWEVKRLGDVGVFLKGSGVKKEESLSGPLPCIRYGEIYTRHTDYIKEFYSFISAEVAATAQLLKKGDLLFAGSGETKAEIGKCIAFVNGFEAYAGGDIVILRPVAVDSLYLGFSLNTASINLQKSSRGQGDAVVHIGSSALADIVVDLPSVPEQTAIATILSDMDTELAELEARLAKARHIKQGMMQELLTGRIRLL